MAIPDFWQSVLLAYAAIELVAVVAAIDAVMEARTAQGATAWAISLVAFPLLGLPLYLVFGRSKFRGYAGAHRAGEREIRHLAVDLRRKYLQRRLTSGENWEHHLRSLQQLAPVPVLSGNDLLLLRDGEATFRAIFDSIDRARDYVLVQFYLVRNDSLGRKFRTHLVRKACSGVRVYFLYDEIGSHKLPPTYIQELSAAGVEIVPFHTTKGRVSRFQINFRNHRKILVVDGEVAYLGGHNVGEEYLGQHHRLTPWRDTHCAVRGPAVLALQLSFLQDWHWATRRVPPLRWDPEAHTAGDVPVLILPTGPADKLDSCSLFFTQLIHGARRRLWISSPYFVPDESVISALQLAALRGVEVRIMLPGMPDRLLVYLASFAYFDEITAAGIQLYRHRKGFLHQKVVLVDDHLAAVGTANLDNRSLRLNFEITLLARDEGFAGRVERMLEQDFSHCEKLNPRQLRRPSLPFRIVTRLARLLAPIL